MTIVYFGFGLAFGFVLSRSGAADYDMIQGMFLFEQFQLYGIMGSAVAIAAPCLWLLRKYGRTITGRPIAWDLKTAHGGNLAGGLIFGIGWSMTGMCPGPMFVNIGEGKIYAAAALAGALVGAGAFGALYSRLRVLFALPAIGLGAGER